MADAFSPGLRRGAKNGFPILLTWFAHQYLGAVIPRKSVAKAEPVRCGAWC